MKLVHTLSIIEHDVIRDYRVLALKQKNQVPLLQYNATGNTHKTNKQTKEVSTS